jgi:hypothetical protein
MANHEPAGHGVYASVFTACPAARIQQGPLLWPAQPDQPPFAEKAAAVAEPAGGASPGGKASRPKGRTKKGNGPPLSPVQGRLACCHWPLTQTAPSTAMKKDCSPAEIAEQRRASTRGTPPRDTRSCVRKQEIGKDTASKQRQFSRQEPELPMCHHSFIAKQAKKY